jgi:hypothetical protein
LLFLFVRVHVLVLYVSISSKYNIQIDILHCFGISLSHNILLRIWQNLELFSILLTSQSILPSVCTVFHFPNK